MYRHIYFYLYTCTCEFQCAYICIYICIYICWSLGNTHISVLNNQWLCHDYFVDPMTIPWLFHNYFMTISLLFHNYFMSVLCMSWVCSWLCYDLRIHPTSQILSWDSDFTTCLWFHDYFLTISWLFHEYVMTHADPKATLIEILELP